MKSIIFRIPLALLLIATMLQGCVDRTVQIFEANVPVMQSWDDFRARTISMDTPQPLRVPGKIYVYDNLLLVNEVYKGVHFFDNSNPSAPSPIGFLPVHGNMDMAVRNDVLYLDNYTDLVSFDISDPANPRLLDRFNNAFQPINMHFIEGYNSGYPMAQFQATEGVIVGWEIKKTKDEIGGYYPSLFEIDVVMAGNSTGTVSQSNSSGIAGSMARFAVYQNYLYTLESSELTTYNISDGITLGSTLALNRNAETLFPAQGNLFIGTTTGMLIYSLNSPENPSFVSAYDHISACDPVVVDGNRAFVTLRTGNNCFGQVNALDVVDLTNLAQPQLLYTFPMTNPRGLGVADSLLFLCDGPDGLKIFNRNVEGAIPSNMLSNFGGIVANDVIPHNQVLILTSEEGIFQYSFADPQNVVQLSMIPVVN